MATKQKYSNETMYEVLYQVMKNLSEILVEHNDNIKSLQGKTIPVDTKAIEQCSFALKNSKEGLDYDIRVLEDYIKVLERKINDLKSIKIEPIDTTSLDNFRHVLEDYRTKLKEIANTTIKVEQVDTTAFSYFIEEMTRVLNEGNSNIKSTIQGIKVEQKGIKGGKFLISMWILSILILIFSGGYGYYFMSNISKYEGLTNRHSYLETAQKELSDYYKEFPEEKEKYLNWLNGKSKGGESTPPKENKTQSKKRK